jgi:hypothetical protein
MPRGGVGGVAPLEKFSCKKSERGGQGQNLHPLDFSRNLRKNFKGRTKENFLE